MPYDDDPYWGGFGKTAQAPANGANPANAPRSLPEASDVTRSQKTARASKPSPLLQEWLRERGLVVL